MDKHKINSFDPRSDFQTMRITERLAIIHFFLSIFELDVVSCQLRADGTHKNEMGSDLNQRMLQDEVQDQNLAVYGGEVLESKEVYGGEVLPRKEMLKVQKLLKIKGLNLPNRIITDDERDLFEEQAKGVLAAALDCTPEATDPKVPGCERPIVKVESESLIQHAQEGVGNNLDLLTTFIVYGDRVIEEYPSLVAHGLGNLLPKIRTSNGGFFDGVEGLEVYAWGDTTVNGVQADDGSLLSHFKLRDGNTASGNLFKAADAGSDRSSINALQKADVHVAKSDDYTILHNGMIASFIVAAIFGLVLLTAIFLKSNARKKSKQELPEDEFTFEQPELHQRTRMKRPTTIKGIMDDHEANFDAI